MRGCSSRSGPRRTPDGAHVEPRRADLEDWPAIGVLGGGGGAKINSVGSGVLGPLSLAGYIGARN